MSKNMSGIKLEDDTRYWTNTKGHIHRENGPAIIYPHGLELWFIEGRELFPEKQRIAKGIIDGSLFHLVPLYINDPILKYFCQAALKNGT